MTAATEPIISFLESSLGLSFSGPRRDRLLAAIEEQRIAANQSTAEFLASVSRPGRAYDRLVARVTVAETYFFRDRGQCELLRSVVLPDLRERTASAQPLRMWSAGCASGEEAFTLAALAEESGLGDRCAVVGSDASAHAIDKAQRAEYGTWSMRSVTPDELTRHFTREVGRFCVHDRLRRRTRFVQRNLLDGPPPPGRFHLVLCRNLLIYLTRDAVTAAAAVLADSLAPQGWLLTAAGDPPLQTAAALEPVRTRYGLAYRRADARTRSAAAPRRAVPAPASLPTTGAARPARSPSPSLAAAPDAAPPVPPVEQLARQVRELGDAGRLEEACGVAGQAVQAHPLEVELRYLAGVVLLEAGRLEEAATAAAAAVYLGPQLAAVHLLLGQVEHARGNTDRARRSFRNGSRLLAAAPGETRIALAGDVPAGHLAAVAARYLQTHRVSC